MDNLKEEDLTEYLKYHFLWSSQILTSDKFKEDDIQDLLFRIIKVFQMSLYQDSKFEITFQKLSNIEFSGLLGEIGLEFLLKKNGDYLLHLDILDKEIRDEFFKVFSNRFNKKFSSNISDFDLLLFYHFSKSVVATCHFGLSKMSQFNKSRLFFFKGMIDMICVTSFKKYSAMSKDVNFENLLNQEFDSILNIPGEQLNIIMANLLIHNLSFPALAQNKEIKILVEYLESFSDLDFSSLLNYEPPEVEIIDVIKLKNLVGDVKRKGFFEKLFDF